MKFVHIADMHFDTPFTSLAIKDDLGEIRRLEQRKIFKKIIDYIQKNQIEYLFIAGDLYEQEYVKQSTMEYICSLFKQIPHTKILIAPGNHDPYIKGSYYETLDWPSNVYIFKNTIDQYEDDTVIAYGTAFTEFYMEQSPLENFVLKPSSKLNILIMHGDLNGTKDAEGYAYQPISETKLNRIGFDYVAMGHIHKNNLDSTNRIYYPGSPISLGFDEMGEHGMIVGEITKETFHKEFVRLDDRIFTEMVLNVDNISSKEQLLEYILDLRLEKTYMYKLVLTGKRNFEINPREILKIIASENILKIKDLTKIQYDLETLAKENNLRGIFIQEVLKKYKSGEYTEEEIEKAIEIGLEAM